MDRDVNWIHEVVRKCETNSSADNKVSAEGREESAVVEVPCSPWKSHIWAGGRALKEISAHGEPILGQSVPQGPVPRDGTCTRAVLEELQPSERSPYQNSSCRNFLEGKDPTLDQGNWEEEGEVEMKSLWLAKTPLPNPFCGASGGN